MITEKRPILSLFKAIMRARKKLVAEDGRQGTHSNTEKFVFKSVYLD